MIEVNWCSVYFLLLFMTLFDRHDVYLINRIIKFSFMSFSDIRLRINDGWKNIEGRVYVPGREFRLQLDILS